MRTRSKHSRSYFVQESMPVKVETLIPDYFGLKRFSEAKRKAHICLALSISQPAEVYFSCLHLKRNLLTNETAPVSENIPMKIFQKLIIDARIGGSEFFEE